MKKEEIASAKSNKAIGPYSQAVRWGNLIFVSGQIGLDPKTNNLVAPDIKSQTRQTIDNLENVLSAGNSSLDDVLKTTVYLTNLDNFPIMNEIYASYFKRPYPARATVEVRKLPKGAIIEIDCIAFIEYPPSHKTSADKGGCCKDHCQCNCC